MTPSALQTQYPLSPRKFWKKFLSQSFFFLILLFVIEMLAIVISVAASYEGTVGLPLGAVFAGFGAWLIAIGLNAWYIKAYIRTYYYDASESFVTIKKGVFAPTEIHVQYGKIQDVFVDQDILDRIMGLYDVHIASATAASAIEAHIDGVEKEAAEGLKNMLLTRIQGGTVLPGTPAVPVPAAPAIPLSEEISSTTYPIAPAWIWQVLLSSILSALIFALPFTFFLGVPGKHSEASLAETFGFGVGDLVALYIALGVVFYLFQVVYMLFWKATYSFAFLPEYVMLRQGVISRQETHLPYRSVQDVAVSQSLVERLLGLATVRIENAAAPIRIGKQMVSSALRIPGQPLAKANHISEAIRSTVLARSASQTGV